MKLKFIFLGCLIPILLTAGCGRKFQLLRGEEIAPSPWPFERNTVQARGSIESPFSGQLNLKWESKVEDGPIGPLALGAGRLIFSGSKGRLHFFNSLTGRKEGRLKTRTAAQTGLTLFDSLAYMGLAPHRNRFLCINLYNRRTVWSLPLKDVTGMPIIIGNRLYVCADSGTVYCLNRLDGKTIWQAQSGARSIAGPSYDEGIVYIPTDNGRLKGYDVETGKMILDIDLKQPLVTKVALDDKVYVAGTTGILFALDKKSGEMEWQRKFPWPVWTSPAVDENMVFIGDGGGTLLALDKSDGRTLWEFKSDGVILSSPIVVGNYLIFASLDKNVYCLDKKNGLLVSKRELKHEIRFPLISDGKRIFAAAHDGTIQCFED